jgi:hypothetical protein
MSITKIRVEHLRDTTSRKQGFRSGFKAIFRGPFPFRFPTRDLLHLLIPMSHRETTHGPSNDILGLVAISNLLIWGTTSRQAAKQKRGEHAAICLLKPSGQLIPGEVALILGEGAALGRRREIGNSAVTKQRVSVSRSTGVMGKIWGLVSA